MNYRLTYDKAVPKSVRKNTPGYSALDNAAASTEDVNFTLTTQNTEEVGGDEDDDDSEDEAEELEAADLLAAENAAKNSTTSSAHGVIKGIKKSVTKSGGP